MQPAHLIIAGLDVVESARSAFADMPTELDTLWRFGCSELLADMTKFEYAQLFVVELYVDGGAHMYGTLMYWVGE